MKNWSEYLSSLGGMMLKKRCVSWQTHEKCKLWHCYKKKWLTMIYVVWSSILASSADQLLKVLQDCVFLTFSHGENGKDHLTSLVTLPCCFSVTKSRLHLCTV